jgi:hypothetical protein
MLGLSPKLIEAMGYKEHHEDDVLIAKYGVLNVYTLQGIHLDEDDTAINTKKFTFGENCTLAISQSINKASQLLTGENYTDESEETWLSQQKAVPPFMLIYFKENKERKLQGGFRQEDESYIHTYDAEFDEDSEVIKWEKQKLPSIITSLTVHFSTLKNQVKFIHVDKSFFGKTKNGKTVFNTKFSMSGELIFPVIKKTNDLALNIKSSYDLYSQLNEKSSRHIYAALGETDRLKKFINYFLFIERFTHSQYKKLSGNYEISPIFNIPERLNDTGLEFFKSCQENAKNLSQRFHWCALLVWDNIDNQDIKNFKKVKSIRDKISHGEDIGDTSLPVEIIKILALKLLGTK